MHAKEVTERTLGPHHPTVASLLNNPAALLVKQVGVKYTVRDGMRQRDSGFQRIMSHRLNITKLHLKLR